MSAEPTTPIVHENLRTPRKRRAPQRHRRALAAVAGSYPSPNYSSRGGTKVTGIVIHTAEGITDATSLGAFFAQPARQASSHVGIDEVKTVAYVDPRFEAWTLRNGNPWTENAEMCGFAAWTRADWLAHPGMVQQAATWVAARCKANGIPPVRITSTDIAAGRRTGYFAHWDYTLGTGDGTHWDVGTGFPWDVFAGLVQAAYNPTSGGFLMALSDAEQAEILAAVREMRYVGKPFVGAPTHLAAALGDTFLHARTAAAQATLAAKAADPAAIAAAVVAAIPAGTGNLSEADVEAALRKVLGSLDNTPA